MVSGKRVYSVPRKLDLASLFVFTTCYGLLFALMNLFRAGAWFFAIVAGFLTCVGVSQAVLFKGKAPRLASCVSGALYCLAILFVVELRNGMRLIQRLDFSGVLIILLFGCAVGYVSGACIGGVFLVADALRTRLKSYGIAASDETDADSHDG